MAINSAPKGACGKASFLESPAFAHGQVALNDDFMGTLDVQFEDRVSWQLSPFILTDCTRRSSNCTIFPPSLHSLSAQTARFSPLYSNSLKPAVSLGLKTFKKGISLLSLNEVKRSYERSEELNKALPGPKPPSTTWS